jgi:hypothetical protein
VAKIHFTPSMRGSIVEVVGTKFKFMTWQVSWQQKPVNKKHVGPYIGQNKNQ